MEQEFETPPQEQPGEAPGQAPSTGAQPAPQPTVSSAPQGAPSVGFTPVEQPGVYAAPPGTYPSFPFGMTPELFLEKQKIKKTAKMIGIALLVFMGISVVWSIIYILVALRMGLSYEKAMQLIQEPAMMQILQIVISILLFTLPFVLVFKAYGERVSDLVPLGKPKKGLVFPMFFMGIAFCGFANIAISILGEFLSKFGIEYHVDYGKSPAGWFGFALSLLSTVVTPALVEEFACRGLILGSLRKYGDGFAVMTSSIIFGLLHGNFEQMPFAFLVGLVLGFIAVETGSLWVGVAVHGFNNLVSVVFEYLLNDLSQTTQNLLYAAFLAICLLLGLAGLFFVRDRNEGFRFQQKNMQATEKQKYKWFFTSVPIIIFAVLCLLESLFYF